jgi:hypothetical protein
MKDTGMITIERVEKVGAFLRDLEEDLQKHGAKIVRDIIITPRSTANYYNATITVEFNTIPRSGCNSQSAWQEGDTSE